MTLSSILRVQNIVDRAIIAAENQSLTALASIFLGSVLAWTLLWFVVHHFKRGSNTRLSPDERIEWDSRVVSLIHAVMCIYGGWKYFFGHSLFAVQAVEATFQESKETETWLMLTAGYLFYDLILCIYYARILGSWTTYMHHTVVILAFTIGAALRIGTFYMAAFLINEVSTIFLNFNYFLAVTPKLRDTLVYKINGVLFLLTFTVFRTIQNSAVTYHMLARSWKHLMPVARALPRGLQSACIALTLLSFAHTGLNIYWLGDVVRASSRKLGRPTAGATATPSTTTSHVPPATRAEHQVSQKPKSL